MAELARNRYGYHSGSTALVPGCGRAYDAIALAQHGFAKVVAVDISKAACAAARALIAKSAPGVSSIEVVNANFRACNGATLRFYLGLHLFVRARSVCSQAMGFKNEISAFKGRNSHDLHLSFVRYPQGRSPVQVDCTYCQ